MASELAPGLLCLKYADIKSPGDIEGNYEYYMWRFFRYSKWVDVHCPNGDRAILLKAGNSLKESGRLPLDLYPGVSCVLFNVQKWRYAKLSTLPRVRNGWTEFWRQTDEHVAMFCGRVRSGQAPDYDSLFGQLVLGLKKLASSLNGVLPTEQSKDAKADFEGVLKNLGSLSTPLHGDDYLEHTRLFLETFLFEAQLKLLDSVLNSEVTPSEAERYIQETNDEYAPSKSEGDVDLKSIKGVLDFFNGEEGFKYSITALESESFIDLRSVKGEWRIELNSEHPFVAEILASSSVEQFTLFMKLVNAMCKTYDGLGKHQLSVDVFLRGLSQTLAR